MILDVRKRDTIIIGEMLDLAVNKVIASGQKRTRLEFSTILLKGRHERIRRVSEPQLRHESLFKVLG